MNKSELKLEYKRLVRSNKDEKAMKVLREVQNFGKIKESIKPKKKSKKSKK